MHVLRGTDDISAATMWVSVTFLWLQESTTNKATYRRKRQFGFIFSRGTRVHDGRAEAWQLELGAESACFEL